MAPATKHGHERLSKLATHRAVEKKVHGVVDQSQNVEQIAKVDENSKDEIVDVHTIKVVLQLNIFCLIGVEQIAKVQVDSCRELLVYVAQDHDNTLPYDQNFTRPAFSFFCFAVIRFLSLTKCCCVSGYFTSVIFLRHDQNITWIRLFHSSVLCYLLFFPCENFVLFVHYGPDHDNSLR